MYLTSSSFNAPGISTKAYSKARFFSVCLLACVQKSRYSAWCAKSNVDRFSFKKFHLFLDLKEKQYPKRMRKERKMEFYGTPTQKRMREVT
jgi:hypothetical protein